MRSFTSRTTEHILFCLAMICMMVGGWNVLTAHATLFGDSAKVTIPYVHIYDAEKDRTGDVFTYQIKPLAQAPVPEGSKNGVYYFTVKGVPEATAENGQVDLTVDFDEPGVYCYQVSAYAPRKVKGFAFENRAYTVNVFIMNDGEGGYKTPIVIATGEDGRKYSRLQFNPSHDSKEVTVITNPISTPDGAGNQTVTLNGNPNGGQAATASLGQQLRDYLSGEDDVTLSDLADEALPKADFNREYWSLFNLILMILTIALCIVLIARYMDRIDTDEDAYVIRREGKIRLLGIVPAVVAVVTFLRTEKIGQHMRLTDEWTVFMLVVFSVSVLIALIAYWKYDRKGGQDNNRMEGQAV